MSPQRIQLRRTKGWRLPDGAINVARPTRWGNPYVIGEGQISYVGPAHGEAGWYGERDVWADVPLHDGLTATEAVQLYRDEITDLLGRPDDDEWDAVERRDELRAALAELRGHDLACWCHLCDRHTNGRPWDQPCDDCDPCHADVVLELANREQP